MSKIICKCGNVLPDTTDRISYKGYLVPDNEYFDILDLIDKMIESKKTDRKELVMTYRKNIRLKNIYQCYNCGRIMIETASGNFCTFLPEEHDNKNILDYNLIVK